MLNEEYHPHDCLCTPCFDFRLWEEDDLTTREADSMLIIMHMREVAQGG